MNRTGPLPDHIHTKNTRVHVPSHGCALLRATLHLCATRLTLSGARKGDEFPQSYICKMEMEILKIYPLIPV